MDQRDLIAQLLMQQAMQGGGGSPAAQQPGAIQPGLSMPAGGPMPDAVRGSAPVVPPIPGGVPGAVPSGMEGAMPGGAEDSYGYDDIMRRLRGGV
jgi:hypothetical protein